MPDYMPDAATRGKDLREARKALGLSAARVTEVLGIAMGYEMPNGATQVSRWEGELNAQLGPIALTAFLRLLDKENGPKVLARVHARMEKAAYVRETFAQDRWMLSNRRKIARVATRFGMTLAEWQAQPIEESTKRLEQYAAEQKALKDTP